MPRLGPYLNEGSKGAVYENAEKPGWVVKKFFQGRGSPLQARNQYNNLQAARRISPDNVVEAEAPLNPRQGWLVKQQVFESDTPPDMAQYAQIVNDLQVQDAGRNLMWGYTLDNPSPRWILIE